MEISQRVLSLMYKKSGLLRTEVELQNTESTFNIKCFNGYAVARKCDSNIYYPLEYPTLEELTQEQIDYVSNYVTASDSNDVSISTIDESDVMLAYGRIVK